MNFRAILLQAAERNPSLIAIKEGDNQINYAELAEKAMRIADSLVSLGINHGDRVAMSMRNSTEFVLALAATQMLGAVAVPFNFRLKADTVCHVLGNSGAKAVILDSALDKTERAIALARSPEVMVIDAHEQEGGERPSLASLEADGIRQLHNEIDRNDLSLVVYTSGTTGVPKGVPLTHRNNYARLVTYMMTTGPYYDTNARTLGAAPLYHTVGIHWILMQTLIMNGTYYPVSRVDEAVARMIETEKINFLFGSPTMIRQVLKSTSGTIDSVKYVAYGSAPTDQPLLDAMFKRFPCAQISEVYGTTEGSIPFVTRSMAGCRPGTLRVTGDFRVRLVVPDGASDEQVPLGEPGELIVHTENAGIFERYYGEGGEAKAAEKLRDGWLYSGDIFTRDAEGNYFFQGRYDDMFVSGGENIQPVEIENVLYSHDAVSDVAVVGVSDPEWSNIVTACVVTDGSVTATDLDNHCRNSSLENFKRPRRYEFVDAIPRNPSGKILRKEMLARLTSPEKVQARAG